MKINIRADIKKQHRHQKVIVTFQCELLEKLNTGIYHLGGKDILLDINGASFLTGFSKQKIYSLISRNKIPFLRRARRVLFIEEALRQWIKCENLNIRESFR